jgi:hypothetical protein
MMPANAPHCSTGSRVDGELLVFEAKLAAI